MKEFSMIMAILNPSIQNNKVQLCSVIMTSENNWIIHFRGRKSCYIQTASYPYISFQQDEDRKYYNKEGFEKLLLIISQNCY